MQHVAANHDLDVEDLCMKVSWPLHTKYKCAFAAFKKHADGELNIWDELDFTKPGTDISHLADKIKEDIDTHMKRRLLVSTVRVMTKCEVSCYEYEGIDAITAALDEGLKASKEG